MSGPYATAAGTYWSAGWRGVLPLPPRAKKNPPNGYTGASGIDPSFPDVQAWTDGREGAGNIGLRLPIDVIGIDVDDYDGKGGGNTFTAAEKAYGKLPPTWRTTSRDDGVSGIRLYRVPPGKAWEQIGPGIETIQRSHRYAVVWPSIHPDTGLTYRWIGPSGVVSTVIPNLDELPSLPAAWIAAYNKGESVDVQRNSMPNTAAATWLASLPGSNGDPCRRMGECVNADVAALERQMGSAHDQGCQATARLVRLAAEGHPGVLRVMGRLHKAFVDNTTSKRRKGSTRSPLEAEVEWRDLIVSAVNLVSADMPAAPSCDCDGALTALILTDPTRPEPTTTQSLTDGSAALALQPDLAPGHDDTDDDLAHNDRTSWWPRDLGPVLSGEQTEPPPTVLTRDDGQPLWYAGKINGLIGESESGKTWVALLAVAQELQDGGRVLYLDFEDAAPGIVSRLRAIGVTHSQLHDLLDYSDPAESLNVAASTDLSELLRDRTYTLIVIDGFNAAMTLLGLDLMSNTDVTKFFQLLLRPLAKTGATVAYVDHIGKSAAVDQDSKGGIGAQAKRAMTTGCVIKVRVGEPFGRGMTGRLAMIVDKDRAGHVRGNSGGGGRDAGTAVLTSNRETGSVDVQINAPDGSTPAERQRGKQMQLMERISDWLATEPEKTSVRSMREAFKGDRNAFDEALETLIKRGHIERQNAGSGYSHTLLQPFSIAGDLASENATVATVADRGGLETATVGPNPSEDRGGVADVFVSATVATSSEAPLSHAEIEDRGGSAATVYKPSMEVACSTCFRPVPQVIADSFDGRCGKCAAEAGLM